MTEYVEEPPVGFSVCYYDARGLRVVPVATHQAENPEVVKLKLFTAWQTVCAGLAPKSVRDGVHRALDDGPEAA